MNRAPAENKVHANGAENAPLVSNGGTSLELTRCPQPVLDDVYSKRMIPLPSGFWEPMNVYIPREEGDYLYSLVRQLRPSLTLEIGMANGLSSCFIAQALKDNGCGRHIAIDPFQRTEWKGAGVALLTMAGLNELVEVVEKYSHQALPELEQRGTRAQLIFVDGSHLFDYVMADFLCSDRILDVGGFLAFDDSDWPSIAQVLRFIVANRRYEVAFPDVVIENPCYHPTGAGRLARRIAQLFPKVKAKLRPDFLRPNFELGLRGRCVVLRKTGVDERESQSRFHEAF